MRIKQLLSILGLTAVGLTAIAQVATAGAAKDQYTGDIYVTGVTPNIPVKAHYSGRDSVKQFTANACGIVIARPGWNGFYGTDSKTILIDGESTTFGAIPTITATARPKCSNGTATNLPSGGVAKYVLSNIAYVVWTGKTPFQQYDVTIPNSEETRSVSSNSCGVVRIANREPFKNPTGSISLRYTDGGGIASVNPSTVATVTAPPGCKNNTLLLPTGFPN